MNGRFSGQEFAEERKEGNLLGKQEARICSGDKMNPQRLGGNRELSQLLTKAPPPSPWKPTWKNN